MKPRALLAGMAGIVFASTAAFATDTPQLIVPPPLPVVTVPPPPSFTWAGAYVSAAYQRVSVFQGAVGFNVARRNLVLGTEILAGYEPGGGLSIGVGLRAGVPIGSRDRVLLYGSSRLYWAAATTAFPATFDLGAEIRLTERVSVFAEGGLYATFTPGTGIGCCGTSLHAGVSFRLGR